MNALDRVVLKFRHEGVNVDVDGLNEASKTLMDRFAAHDKGGATDAVLSAH